MGTITLQWKSIGTSSMPSSFVLIKSIRPIVPQPLQMEAFRPFVCDLIDDWRRETAVSLLEVESCSCGHLNTGSISKEMPLPALGKIPSCSGNRYLGGGASLLDETDRKLGQHGSIRLPG